MKKKIRNIILEDNFLSLAGNLVIAVFGLAGFALLTRSFEPSAFGQWVLFISGGSFIEMLRFGITNTGVIRFLSGAEKVHREQLIGSNVLICLVTTVIITSVLVICNHFFRDAIHHSGYSLFFLWYPLLAFINLPWNNALVTLQADRKFGKVFFLKATNSVSFFAVLLLNYFFFSMTLTQVVLSMLIINAVTSLVSILAGWDGIKQMSKANKQINKQILGFGKYTTFTLLGTNLLRSSDTLIIGLSSLGSSAVALYSIPLKLTELQQIPLRSFAATAFPKMSKASMHNNIAAFKKLFYEYSGAITYLFIFISLCSFFFADLFVLILGGKQYLGIDPMTGFSAVSIVKMFSIYGLLLPIDRMTGIGLDSINKPHINAVKVFFMVVANIIGDVIAVFFFKSLILVAVSSIFFTIIGIYIGMLFLNKEIGLEYKEIFRSGKIFYQSQLRKLFDKETKVANA